MSDSDHPVIRIGLAGLGNVGLGVYSNLVKNRQLLTERTGAQFEVRRIAVRDPSKEREIEVPRELMTTRWQDLVEDPEVQVVVELIGGVEQAFELVAAALRARKVVVTGNKALLAERGKELFALAEEHGAPIYFEAAVCGGIPIIKTVQEAFVGNHIRSIYGIINGTSNYILTRMKDAGLSYEAALQEAQALGYAEADPTLDVNGWDAAHKAIILASLSYGKWLRPEDVMVEGIENISLTDIRFAEDLGYVIKLLSIIRVDEGGIEVRVQPSLIPASHVLASVNGVFNAIAVLGDVVGETLFYGRGAGQDPTASSVISDLADTVWAVRYGAQFSGFVPHGLYGQPKPIDETRSQYYVRLTVDDLPGVLGQVAAAFGEAGVGIRTVLQPGLKAEPGVRPEPGDAGRSATLMLLMHEAPLGEFRRAIDSVARLDCVRATPVWMRVESVAAEE